MPRHSNTYDNNNNNKTSSNNNNNNNTNNNNTNPSVAILAQVSALYTFLSSQFRPCVDLALGSFLYPASQIVRLVGRPTES